MKTIHLVLLLTVVGVADSNAQPQPDAESAAIRQVALDYIEGWYAGDAESMERALHPDLAKRSVQSTRTGLGSQTPVARRLKEVSILDRFGSAASVKIVASDWVDYLHLVRWNGEWKIIDVLWEPTPQ